MPSLQYPILIFGIILATPLQELLIMIYIQRLLRNLFLIFCSSTTLHLFNAPPVNESLQRRSQPVMDALKSLSGISTQRTSVVMHSARMQQRNFILENRQL